LQQPRHTENAVAVVVCVASTCLLPKGTHEVQSRLPGTRWVDWVNATDRPQARTQAEVSTCKRIKLLARCAKLCRKRSVALRNNFMELNIRTYQPTDEEQVINLWQECCLVVPQNNPQRDILLKLQVQPELFLVGSVGSQVVASIMAGYEGHRGWFNYLRPGHKSARRLWWLLAELPRPQPAS
jgi:hypothetical protein